ncbi:MAG: CDP-glycerol glycerophosphotransferase family protein [Firmicutes bacterium]|nr:CDP-glycerol glycerophosphotransferase family protein [Bacillota bacterium]
MKKARIRFFISILDIKGSTVFLEGYTSASLEKGWRMAAKDQNGKSYPGELFHLPNRDKFGENGVLTTKGMGFRLQLPLKAGRNYSFWLLHDEEKNRRLVPSFGKFAKLTQKSESCYYAKGSYLIRRSGSTLEISKNRKKSRIKAEWRLLRELLKAKEYQLAVIRLAAWVMRKLKKEEQWIICDRSYLAGDNGEALFRYICKEKPAGVKAYFMLDPKSRDFDRMKAVGPVLKKDSFYYKCRFLCADKIISSHADPWVTDAFMEKQDYMRNMYDFSFVFLQHGIGMNDMSVWLHKHNKNISLLVTSAKPEYDSFFTYPYEYGKDVVRLTGLPRYDNLSDEAEKRIVFLPTWRKNLAGPVVKGSSEHIYTESFKDSAYCKFYNALINDEVLLQVMKENGYHGEFYVHPSFDAQQKDFQGNDIIKVIGETARYNEVFRKNALLITDYSSVAFDFAYMKKPVIYAQFDKDSFFGNHLFTEGYFQFPAHGFGPVCENYDETVAAIISSIQNDCRMPEQYKQRVDDFFMYTDGNNCKRVLHEIMNM